ncbi:LexA family transcriptional regulator [Dyadobacter sandarakinus]|uniref:LexA family transcriptional regulator n=1 Tax=Dyadobacter sandarakinus TaxID=2747268 RepID=A0ABX7I7G6_9BACT|nr:LexA family transcriptional regulator [Dyadobacter sandarakinus]QRR01830.1 LexA family transcriptional regulator [Dyadobacter sandarakinus]
MAVDQEFKRFKQIREELNLTQAAFAEELGISTTTADIERGKTRIPGQVVKELLRRYYINPLWLYGDSSQKYLNMDKVPVQPRVVTVDQLGKDNIVLVNAKAAAGYPHNIGDAQWFEKLPAFSIPLPEYRNASFRGFQVDGDSMLPVLQSGEWIVGKAVEDWSDINNKQIYVVVTADSILVKKVNKTEDGLSADLISLNFGYDPIRVSRDDVQELWAVSSKFTFDLTDNAQNVSLQGIYQEMKVLRQEVKRAMERN